MIHVLAAALLAAQVVLPAGCLRHKDAAAALQKKYGEQFMAVGSMKGARVELWRTKNGSGWTMLVTQRGISCLVAAGTNWREAK